MESGTCLKRIRAYLEKRGWEYEYHEEDGCGSIDFSYRGVPYHIWEFEEGERGVETNLQHGGRQEDVLGDFETKLIEMIESWK